MTIYNELNNPYGITNWLNKQKAPVPYKPIPEDQKNILLGYTKPKIGFDESIGTTAPTLEESGLPLVTPIPAQQAQQVPTAPVASVQSTPTTSNILTPQARPPYVPQTEYEKYWGQKIGTQEHGIPLNRFVGLAGKAAYALDPKGFGGVLGKQLSDEADVATNEMARREYEGPNKLLQRSLQEQQVRKGEREELAQKDISVFTDTWDAKEKQLLSNNVPRDQIDREYVRLLAKAYSKHDPEKAAALIEKAIEADRNGAFKEYAQKAKDYINELKLEQVKLEYERKLKSDTDLSKYRLAKLGLESERLKVAKEEAAKSSTEWYTFGTDPVTKKIVYVNKDGESKLGDLPKDVASVAPKVEKPMTEKQKSEEETAKIVRLALINRNRRRDGLSPLNELPVEGVKKESKDIKPGSKEQALEAIKKHKSNPAAVKAIKDTYKKLHPGDSL
jgi:hypothetical protein